MKLRSVAIAIALSVSIIVSACSGAVDDSSPSTEPLPQDLPELEFGSGVLPITVPSNFPMPEPSAITTTMIDGSRELTEVAFNAGGGLDEVKTFYATNLPELGYDVLAVSDEGGIATINFVGHGIDGAVTLKVAGQGVTTGTLTFVYL